MALDDRDIAASYLLEPPLDARGAAASLEYKVASVLQNKNTRKYTYKIFKSEAFL